jgi:ankyrin repeat protein
MCIAVKTKKITMKGNNDCFFLAKILSPFAYFFHRGNFQLERETQSPAVEHYTDSEIYDACLHMNWQLVEQLCALRPHNARYQEGDNMETALYMACENRLPLTTIQALLQAFPEAVTVKTRRGYLPIHMACRDGEANAEVIRLLLQADCQTACKRTRYGHTPLVSLWEPHSHKLHSLTRILGDRNKSVEEKLNAFLCSDAEKEMNACFAISVLLLEAVARYRQRNASTNRLFLPHAAVSLRSSTGCPLVVLYFVARRFRKDFYLTDSNGRFPVHIAVGPDNSSDPEQLWKFKPREHGAIQLALGLHPESASICDPNEPIRRYPLHTALLNGHEWDEGVKELVHCAPQVLQTTDPILGLFPFQMVSLPTTSTRLVDPLENYFAGPSLNTRFNLLRSDPTVLEMFRKGLE